MKNDILRIIDPKELVCLEDFTESHPLKIDMVYAQPNHKDNIFKEAIYKPDAKMWIHEELLPLVLRASELCFERHKYIFELKDCLRTTDAQQYMIDTKIVRANPHWMEEPKLFASPGAGGHPRGMAIDVILVDQNGDEVDMGTSFDHFTENPDDNPAARNYKTFCDDDNYNQKIIANRKIQLDAVMDAADELGLEIRPLTAEWWDYRFELPYLKTIKPLSDADLPPEMQITFSAQKNRTLKTEPRL